MKQQSSAIEKTVIIDQIDECIAISDSEDDTS